jgi:hypothetical protein
MPVTIEEYDEHFTLLDVDATFCPKSKRWKTSVYQNKKTPSLKKLLSQNTPTTLPSFLPTHSTT